MASTAPVFILNNGAEARPCRLINARRRQAVGNCFRKKFQTTLPSSFIILMKTYNLEIVQFKVRQFWCVPSCLV